MVGPYRGGHAARQQIAKQMEKTLKQDVIETAQSKWASLLVLASEAGETWSFCIDFRKLNSITVRDTYSMPRVDDCAGSIGKANNFFDVGHH